MKRSRTLPLISASIVVLLAGCSGEGAREDRASNEGDHAPLRTEEEGKDKLSHEQIIALALMTLEDRKEFLEKNGYGVHEHQKRAEDDGGGMLTWARLDTLKNTYRETISYWMARDIIGGNIFYRTRSFDAYDQWKKELMADPDVRQDTTNVTSTELLDLVDSVKYYFSLDLLPRRRVPNYEIRVFVHRKNGNYASGVLHRGNIARPRD